MYGDFLAILEARSRNKFEKLEFDYYDKFLYISFYVKSDNTMYLIPYTVDFIKIERYRGQYSFLAEIIIQKSYVKYFGYEYPRKDNIKTHFV